MRRPGGEPSYAWPLVTSVLLSATVWLVHGDASITHPTAPTWITLAVTTFAVMLLLVWLRARILWRQSARRMASMADFASMARTVLLEVSSDGRITWATGATKEILGYPLAYLRGKTLRQVQLGANVPDYGELAVRYASEAVHGPDGYQRLVDVAYLRSKDRSIVAVVRAADDPHLYERAVEEAEARLVEGDGSALHALLATAQNGMALVDPEGHAAFANVAFDELLGWSGETGRDPSLFDLAASGADELRSAVAAAARGEPPAVRLEITIGSASDNPREVVASVSPYRIRGSVAGALVELADVTEERRATREIERLAQFDELTALPNRPHFERRVRERLQAATEDDSFAVLLLDLDRFKTVNDSLGHSAGDRLLVEMSRRLRSTFGDRLLLGRFGGDEFLALVPQIDGIEDTRAIVEEMREVLAAPMVVDDLELNLSASIGVAVFPGDGEDFETLVRHADLAMYRAKRRGGGAFEFANPEHDGDSLDQMHLQAALRRALERSEFQVYYQPQFRSTTLALRGMEALLRWDNEEFELVAPEQFIASLEDTGLIVEVGEFVLGEACAEAARWQARGLPAVPVAVNVAARQMLVGDFALMVRNILADTGLAPELLEIEVTETAGIEHLDEAIEALEELRAMGVRVAIDDFGTGHSSLARLKELPVDTLKLDRSFIAHMHTQDGYALVQGMVSLGHALGMSIVAEGVETDEQLRQLQALRCDAVQGFLLAEAVPISALDAEVARLAALQGQAA